MKKLVAFLTALTLLGGLTACDRDKTEVVPDPLPSVSVSSAPTPTPAPSPTPPTADVALTYDPEELEPWQVAYIQFLEGELEQKGGRFTEEFLYEWPYYYLYDIDKDGVPELILVYDGYYSGIAYTYQQNTVKALNKGTEEDSFWLVDSVLYSYPDGNGVLRYCASNAWSWQIGLYSLKDGELCFDILAQESSEEEPLEEPIDVQDYYPDSRYLNDYSALVTAPERGINFLPIVNYPTPPKADRIPPKQQEQEEKLVQDVIDNNGWFYCVSKYDDDNGWVTLEEYYQRKHTTLSDTQWQDLNDDGVREAVLRSSYHGLILSAQDGVVYGYDLDFVETVELNRRTGIFEDRTRSHGYYSFRAYFAKNQYYETYYEGEVIFPREFTFMNGMGDWRVILQIEEDGSFTGHEEARTWLPMGSEEEGAKGFTDFKGKFTMPEQVNDYTYSMKLEKFQIEPGEETVIDGVRYIPYDDHVTGFDVETEFLVYLPGAPLEELPEDFLLWVKAPMGIEDDETTLSWYGLYNVKEQLGWFEGTF